MGKSHGSNRQDHSAHPAANQPFAALDLGPLPPGPDPLRPRHEPKRERLVLRREKAGRGGRTVVVISGFLPGRPASHFEELALRIRKACGCGGTVRGCEIEIQGDQPDKVRGLLETDGHRVVGP